jgi:hypothetical protein
VSAQGLVETLDLARGGRGGGLGQAVHDPVVPADPIEQHFAIPTEPGVNCLPLNVGQDLVGTP